MVGNIVCCRPSIYRLNNIPAASLSLLGLAWALKFTGLDLNFSACLNTSKHGMLISSALTTVRLRA